MARAATYARQALSPATLAAYAADWGGFEGLVPGQGRRPLPVTPVSVAASFRNAGRHPCRMAGQPWAGSHPALRDTLAGIADRQSTPQRRSAAIGTAEIRRLVATCTDGLTDTRVRALLLLSFCFGAGGRARLGYSPVRRGWVHNMLEEHNTRAEPNWVSGPAIMLCVMQ